MRAPGFWWREPGLAAAALAPLGALYGAGAARRMARAGETVSAPVVCVGNFVAGGAGKTPTAIFLAERLAAAGERPFLLSRGYGGSLDGPALVDSRTHLASEVGDEPLLLAAVAPTVVARDRPAGARFAADRGAGVIILDDGLQNPALAKTVTLAVVDGARGVGNGRCLPAGPLRAPLAAQFARTDMALVIGPGAPGAALAVEARRRGVTVHHGALVPTPQDAERLRGRRVIAVAGLGRPEKLLDTLAAIGAQTERFVALGDHALPSEPQARAIADAARAADALVVTTEKDFVKWRERRPELAEIAVALPVRLVVEDEDGLLARLRAAIAEARGS
ncbi:tetraacyldisaccharide 4'-kinase [Methylopila capsulata]|uniref:Tetraacyldisaccharide 4'-kinase n=1 Tax=Methylopila capsulata TaxID=61654 RepID=A0A9W6IVK0_9HYPH|nr:tetraacyldisaccharide 4'-kinase [Methylopila capsulata]MBM7850815.1 tetraacyldisaccharide 4'-kinase [Methylopila capsulata]GLK56109.1 tetraacyldisaccharide 4'-kinase [Methylopila capsulata]